MKMTPKITFHFGRKRNGNENDYAFSAGRRKPKRK